MNKQLVEPPRKFTTLSRFKVKLKRLMSKFDIEKSHIESLSPTQQKVINVSFMCIENKKSHLYSRVNSGQIQIELPEIFITIVQAHGFYEVDIVYMNQAVPTSDKVIFDASGVMHIYNKFDVEVKSRMQENIKRKDSVIDNHLDNLVKAVETFVN